MTKSFLLASQRSGSTWLITMLNEVPSVELKGEVFLNRKFSVNNYSINKNYNPFSICNEKSKYNHSFKIDKFLDKYFIPYFKNKPAVCGFKIMYNQVLKSLNLIKYMFSKNASKYLNLYHKKLRRVFIHWSEKLENYFQVHHSLNQV